MWSFNNFFYSEIKLRREIAKFNLLPLSWMKWNEWICDDMKWAESRSETLLTNDVDDDRRLGKPAYFSPDKNYSIRLGVRWIILLIFYQLFFHCLISSRFSRFLFLVFYKTVTVIFIWFFSIVTNLAIRALDLETFRDSHAMW